MRALVQPVAIEKLERSLATTNYVTGKTYGFYHYPARFHPDVAKAAIEAFSSPGDLVLDPFMGGGTSVIEALALGRRVLGIDINALAHFVTDVRTTPISPSDEFRLASWAACCKSLDGAEEPGRRSRILNLPRVIEAFVADCLVLAAFLPNRRQHAFARCALLRLGQLALDRTTTKFAVPRRKWLAQKLPLVVADMLSGMRQFVRACRAAGLPKHCIRSHRELLQRSVLGLENDPALRVHASKPKLVLTSPPYPGVHVLYHRWQYRGRKETPAPYWIADVKDGCGSSFYTLGDIKPAGVERYFANVVSAFKSIRAVIADDAWLVQLVGFNNVAEQLPRYLKAMESAGFQEWDRDGQSLRQFSRSVPNRRWYTHLQGPVDASRERLLIHRVAAMNFRN